MVAHIVYENGDPVPTFPFTRDNQRFVVVPLATDEEAGEFFFGCVCTLFLPGHEDARELYIGLLVVREGEGEVVDYNLTEALDRLGQQLWLPFCVTISFATLRLLTLEKLETFHIYLPVYRHDSQLGAMLGVVRNGIHGDYELRLVDQFAGSVLWIGVRRDMNL